MTVPGELPGAQPVADCGTVQPVGSLRRKRKGNCGVVGLLAVGEHRQRAVLGDNAGEEFP